jgi:hypothetical protein
VGLKSYAPRLYKQGRQIMTRKRTPFDYALWAALPMAHTSRIEGRITMILDKTQSRRILTRRVLLFALIPSAAALMTLAALRPTARAQAAPVAIPRPATIAKSNGGSVILPNGTSPLNFHFSHATNIMEGNHAGQMRFITSPDLTINGVQLFAGMTDDNKPSGPWWNAQGVPLAQPVYTTNHLPRPFSHDQLFRQIAFRLPATAQDVTLQYRLPQSTGYSSDGAWPGKSRDQTGQSEAQIFAHTGGIRIVNAQYPASMSQANIQVGIASGSWKVSAVRSVAMNGTTSYPGPNFVIGQLAEIPKGESLTVSTDTTDDLRIVAVDTHGRESLPDSIGGESSNNLNQVTAQFSLPLSQIKDIRVETRPFHWIEFKNVALRPVK